MKNLLTIGYGAALGIVATPKDDSDNKLLEEAFKSANCKGEASWQKNTK